MNVGFAVQQFLQQDTKKNMARMMIKGEHCFSCGLMQFEVLGARCSLLACCLVQQWRVAMHAEQALDG